MVGQGGKGVGIVRIFGCPSLVAVATINLAATGTVVQTFVGAAWVAGIVVHFYPPLRVGEVYFGGLPS